MLRTPVSTKRAATRKAPLPMTPPGASAGTGNDAQAVSAPARTPAIDEETRQRMIAESAYYRAEARGFAPGDELRDWLDAEADIRARWGP